MKSSRAESGCFSGHTGRDRFSRLSINTIKKENRMVLLDLAKSFLANVPPDAAVADFTMGNGHDTAFLCGLVPQGRVYAFDIQPQALENTRLLLAEKGYANATLILDGHEHAKQHIHEPIAAGMFNLGYRPGSDHSVHTHPETTVKAVVDAVELLQKGGVLVICIYPGDEEGVREGEALEAVLIRYSRKRFSVMCHRMINAPKAPYILTAEKY